MPCYSSKCLGTAIALLATASVAAGQCRESPVLRRELAAVLDAPEQSEFRFRYDVELPPGTAAEPVTDSLTCAKVALAISDYRRVPVGGFALVLARAGRHLVAQTDLPSSPDRPRTFVLDSTLQILLPRDMLDNITLGGPVDPPTESLCVGAEEDFSVAILGKIRFVLTSPNEEWYRKLLGVEGIPADSVQHVSDPATCGRAIAAIQTHRGRPGEPVVMVLVRLGRVYWAEASYPRSGEWTLVYILDGTGTKVVGQY